MRISDWSSDVCSSDLSGDRVVLAVGIEFRAQPASTALIGQATGVFEFSTLLAIQAYLLGTLAVVLFIAWLRLTLFAATRDRKSVVSGKSVSVRVDFGGRRVIKKKKKIHLNDRC